MTRLRIVPALFILMGVAASVAAAPPANQDPQLSIAGNKVVVKNLPAGATVMLFGVSVEHIPFSSSTRRYDAVLTDTDHDGTIEWTPRTKPIPQFSVWFAIDVVTGNMGSVAPTGFTPVRFDFPPNGLKRATDGKIVRMDLFTQNLEVIVVRPGEPTPSTTGTCRSRSPRSPNPGAPTHRRIFWGRTSPSSSIRRRSATPSCTGRSKR